MVKYKHAKYCLSILAVTFGTLAGVLSPAFVYAEGGNDTSQVSQEPIAIGTAEMLYSAFYYGGDYRLAADINMADYEPSPNLYAFTKNVNLDLGDYTLSLPAGSSIYAWSANISINGNNGKIVQATNSGDYPAVWAYGGDITLNGGAIQSEKYAVRVNDGKKFIMNGGSISSDEFGIAGSGACEITINGGNINAGYYALNENGNESGAKFYINGGNINSDDYAIYMPHADGVLEITDGQITGAAGAIAMNRGSATISGGTLTSLDTASLPGDVSQDGTSGYSNAVIGLAKEYGAVTLNISGGEFVAQGNAGMIVDPSGLDTSYDETVSLTGGQYSKMPKIEYVSDGYDLYDKGPDGPYFVDVETTVDLPDSLFLQVGEAETVTLSEVAKKYGTFGNSSDVATLSDTTITADKVGSGLINFNLHNYKNPIDRNINVVVYEVTPGENSDIDETSQNVLADFVGRQISELLKSGKTTNGKIAFNSNNLDDLKVRLASGQTIKTVLYVDYKYDEDEYEYADAHDKIMAELGENEKILAIYDVYAEIYSSDGTYLGYVLEMDTPLPFVIDTSLESLAPSIDLEPANGYTRKFSVIRGHYTVDGETSAARVDFARDGSKFTITSDKYSTFVITYTDTQTTPETPETGTITREGGSAMAASVVTAIAVGIITSISSFMFIMNRARK